MSASVSTRRLTEFSHGAGCGCKLGPGQLADVLAGVTPPSHPDLLVGTDTGDDAAVWRLSPDRALVATTDFFTPIVDDARTWGAIAATNAVSDVYAMGGTPLFALNLVCWPSADLGPDALAEVLEGGAGVGRSCGFAVVGGHTIDDPEPKYGLAVVGEVHPDRVLTNAGLRPGDALVLTKPLGIGVISTAVKRGVPAAVDAAVAAMTTPNADAATAAREAGATGCTDVTGYGLLGHLTKMTVASGVDATVETGSVLVLDGVRELVAGGVVPGGTLRNRQWIEDRVVTTGDGTVPEDDLLLLSDAQTSGGLLFGAEPRSAADAVARLRERGHDAAVVGSVTEGTGLVHVRA